MHLMEKIVVLERPENLKKRPTIALCLLVKNGENVIDRLVTHLGPYVDEIVAVVNDTTDGTIDLLTRLMIAYNLKGEIVEVTAETHPQYYILDTSETYQVGQPLVGESYEGPFTGGPLLADWAAMRNLGWDRCRSDWRLFLDADDVLEDPEHLPSVCAALAERGVDLAASLYKYGLLPSGLSRCEGVRERLARNVPYIKWQGRVHETLVGATRRALLQGTIIARDMRDSTGAGIRVPDRNFKVLYHHARASGWQVSPRDFLYMALEIRHSLPEFASRLLDRYLVASTWAEERAWAYCIRGEIDESTQDYDLASRWYESALREFPSSSKAAYRLCRSRFHEHKWQESIDAYHLGVGNETTVQQLDDGEVYADASKILVAACLRRLGRRDEAIAMCEDALWAFPGSTGILGMLAGLRD
jgi:glycosyltransferase involved in cell wall biosynthesis